MFVKLDIDNVSIEVDTDVDVDIAADCPELVIPNLAQIPTDAYNCEVI